MVLKSIFKNVNYPKDRGSIEHIITEYDKNLEFKLHGIPKLKKPGYIFYFIDIGIILFILQCSWISLGIRALYLIPIAISVICNIVLFKKAKNNNFKDEKLFYKYINSNFILLVVLLYASIFMFEIALLGWTDVNCLISLIYLVSFSLLAFIIARIRAPKKFIKHYLKKESNKTPYVPIAGVSLIIGGIVYLTKPYFIALIVSYPLVTVLIGFSAYVIFDYQQYDKIQELKKEINYPK
ncbi:hypothetical protein [Clostridium vincentii]|uniref:Uncharacterized protein n=1 Tax=Clostridium vincentii TaxID=52704 RepID=A0A2T0BBF3_9CLOT|nr:hypothetical protein [Clostridium vincentii]PRR81137.1 hypothetical protein CLVI_27290 [Clostridium vincentii]